MGRFFGLATLLIAACVAGQAHAFVISTHDVDGTPTEGWDGPGLGSATINYFLGWDGAPDGDGITSSGLGIAQIEAEVANAMATWSSVADISFSYLGNSLSNPALASDPWGSPGNETLVIYFHGDEGTNAFPFDGDGLQTVFAHAWGPPDLVTDTIGYAFAGNIHLDAAENWLTGLADGTTYGSVGGIDLETILLHELGHSLGLGHSGSGFATAGGPVMAPFSNQALSTLGADDIAGIRSLYSFGGGEDPDVTPVPEPGSLSLLALGLLVISQLARRRARTVGGTFDAVPVPG